MNQNRWLR